MTYADRWATSRQDGRALLASRDGERWGLWLLQIDGQLILCDDSESGHLRAVDPQEDEETGIRRWHLFNGVFNPAAASPSDRARRVRRRRTPDPIRVEYLALQGSPV